MLTEERLQGIWRIVTEKGSASIQELMDALNISESTVRRDLAVLDEQGRIQKVRGGAMVVGDAYSTKEDSVTQKKDKNLAEKREIAKLDNELKGTGMTLVPLKVYLKNGFAKVR